MKNTIAIVMLALLAVLPLCGCGKRRISEAELDKLIDRVSKEEKVSPALLKAVVWKESKFDNRRVGKKGEIGLMQLMDGAVTDWARAKKRDIPKKDDLFDPELNLEIGAWYLAWSSRLWPGREDREVLQLAAYNAGCGNVERLWLPKDPSKPLTIDMITFSSTREYIKLIQKKKQEFEQQKKKD